MTTTNSYNKTLSIFFACAIASIAVLAISPSQSEACGSYGDFISEEERIENIVQAQIFQLGLRDLNHQLINTNADDMTQRINGFAVDTVRRKGRRATVKLHRLSDGRTQNLQLRYVRGTWKIVKVRTQPTQNHQRSRRAIRA